MEKLHFIDSHTGGEPTRVILAGGPDLGAVSLLEKRNQLEQQFDFMRRTAILEPRGSDVLVGALLCEPEDASCASGVIFFNNKGYLGMCGHGIIGVAASLAYLGRIATGTSQIETPVGKVQVNLLTTNRIEVESVPAYRYRCGVELNVPGLGKVRGDIAWGGNWFYLLDESPLPVHPLNISQLSSCTRRIMHELREQQVTGEGGAKIDHVEVFGPPSSEIANSRNFVLCPGGAYDRSPCGTGTSAKLACLAADGLLAAGQTWVQQSIVGSCFEARYRWLDDQRIVPTITGEAYVSAEGQLLINSNDPYRHGICTEAIV